MTGEETVFQWLGTAGFRIEHAGEVILLDPYLESRSPEARPHQPLLSSDMADADFVFVTHNHFDHIADVPAIAAASGARIFCSGVAAASLARRGVPAGRIEPLGGDEAIDLGAFSVNVFPSKHIMFDLPLILRTAPRVARRGNLKMARMALSKPGVVLAFSFDFAGVSFAHMGSLGMTPEQAVHQRIESPDVLSLPLQGHSHICSRAAELAAAIAPRAVVPQHFDDFFPPISMTVELLPFETMLKTALPHCAYREPEINRRYTMDEIRGYE